MLFVRAARGEIQRVRGKLRQASQLDQELLHLIGERPADVIKIRALGRLASLQYEWNQLEPARLYVHQALELATKQGRESFARLAHLTQARIEWALGDAEMAQQLIERAQEFARRMGSDLPRIEVRASQVRLWLAHAMRYPSEVAEENLTPRR